MKQLLQTSLNEMLGIYRTVKNITLALCADPSQEALDETLLKRDELISQADRVGKLLTQSNPDWYTAAHGDIDTAAVCSEIGLHILAIRDADETIRLNVEAKMAAIKKELQGLRISSNASRAYVRQSLMAA